jgi:glycyl-tRNA synthetase beta chain
MGPFVRPVHWLLVLLGAGVVPCELFGIRSDRFTHGHRFHAPGKIAVESPEAYGRKLHEAGVIVDPAARRRAVREQLLALAAEAGGALVEDARLEEEVTNLVEWPVVVRGEFDRKFLALPPEVTITVMARHQRYFAVKDGVGALLPCFMAVANMDPAYDVKGSAARDEIMRRRASMTRGYERVLTARLEDGVFFFEEDGKKTLEGRLAALEGIVFQRGAGDYRMKARRVEAVARLIAGGLGLDAAASDRCARAALLSKCDLATSMVVELTELQGIMGGIYARRDGEDPAVAGAIAEHYLPASAGDPLPSSTAGSVVSIADKIDSLMTFISLGYRPSSASDPLGFRRLCLGIIRVVLEKGFRIDLRKLASEVQGVVEKDLAAVRAPGKDGGKPKGPREDPVAFFMAFLEDRLKVFWRDRARADILDAALACGVDDLVRADRRLGALLEFHKLPFFDDLAVAFKRAYRISREIGDQDRPVDVRLFEKPEERSLHEAIAAAQPRVREARDREDFMTVLRQAADLRQVIDGYFENVFVNVEDEAVKLNRLSMMKMIADLVEGTARLDLVQFERTKIT